MLIKKSLLGFTPTEVGLLRLSMVGFAFLPIAMVKCRGLSPSTWLAMAAVGIFGTGLPSFLFPLAQQELSSSLAAALSSLTPLMTLLVSVYLFRLPLRLWQSLGILLGFFGAMLLVVSRYGWFGQGGDSWPYLSILLAVLATLCYALSSNIVKRFFGATNPLQVTAGAMAPVGILSFVVLMLRGGLPVDFSANPDLIVAYSSVIFLGLIGTALASWLFFRLVQLTDPVFASTVSYLVPIIALGWGLLDGEVITVLIVVGLCLILAGVNLAKR
jgi:drug/metabolite transporter (DMT)-like permease